MILEHLLKPKNRQKFELIMAHPRSIKKDAAIHRYVKTYLSTHAASGMCASDIDKIDDMVITALSNDFFCEKGRAASLECEKKFDIVDPLGHYRIAGFIDKYALYPEKGLARIVDYKSSKKKFDGEDLTDNVQAKMYSLASKKINPALQPVVEFLFLKFPDAPIQRLRFSEAELEEFEEYLKQTSDKIGRFSPRDATTNLAAKKPMPSEGFSGPLLCGRCKKPNETKADGSPKWGCSFKFPFEYYSLCNDKDETVSTSLEKMTADESKGQYVVKRRYAGCPHFNK
jgi:hypothetical protein